MTVRVPELETPRLVLRGWRHEDADAYAAMAADPEVMRYAGGVLARDDAWRQMALHAGHWVLRGYGNWAVERRTDRALLGRVGLWNPEGWPGVEIGWALARRAWGHGYATEAAHAAMDWAWKALEVRSLISVIHPHNQRSIRLAERLGLRRERDATVRGGPAVIFAIGRPAN